MAALFAVSSIPDDDGTLSRTVLFLQPELQNLLHVPAFALLAWLWWRALAARGVRSMAAAAVAAAIATAYGALDEVHQYFVAGRTASVTDALLDAAGALLVLAWAALSARRGT